MSEKGKRLKYLFEVFQKKTATKKEMLELQHLLQHESNDNIELLYREYSEQLKRDEIFFDPATSEGMLKNIFSKQTRPETFEYKLPTYNHPFKKYLIAALFLITIGAGLLFILTRQEQNHRLSDNQQNFKNNNEIPPGSTKALLKLGDGSVIVLDNEDNGLLRDQKNVTISKIANGQIIFKVKTDNVEENSTALNVIETPKGGQYQVILPDETIVWLNAASSIQFPSSFSGKYRNVKITGEVYFEVAKNATMPFIVELRNSTIEVLGTHFNVMDYEDESLTKTTLLEGSVKITSNMEHTILKPGQQASYSENTSVSLQKVSNPGNEIAWKNGFFVFEGSSIDLVMRQVSRWYDVDVVFHGTIPANEFSGKISRNLKLGEFLKILSYAGFNFKVDGKKIIVIN